MNPKIISIGYALPSQSYTQSELFDMLGYQSPRVKRIFENCGIERRYLWIVPTGKSWQELTQEYEKAAVELSKRAIVQCLDGQSLNDIGCLVFSSCTGYSCPGISHHLARALEMPDNMIHANLVGMGCFPEGHWIVCNLITKDIAAVRIGDRVLSHDGRYHAVSRLYSRPYKGKLIQIKSSLLPIKCTPEHPFLTIRSLFLAGHGGLAKPHNLRTWDWTPKWLKADELGRGDFILVPKLQRQTRTQLKVTDFIETAFELHGLAYTKQESNLKNITAKQRTTAKGLPNNLLNEHFLWICGVFVAEGNANQYGKNMSSVKWTVGEHETTLIEQIRDYLSEMNLETRITPNRGSSGASKSVEVEAYSATLAKLFRLWFGKKARQKRLPDWIYEIESHYQETFISGLWAGDGYKTEYTTASISLAQQLTILLAQLGSQVSLRTIRSGYTGDVIYRVRRHKGMARQYSGQDYLWCPIQEIREVAYDGLVYNLEVEDANSYLCNLATVHNCEAAAPGLSRAVDYVATHNKSALLVSAEPCSCAYFPAPEHDMENTVTNCLFGDAAAAMLIGYDDNPHHPEIVDIQSYFNRDYMDYLGFKWQEGRLKCVLHKDVPKMSGILVKEAVGRLLTKHNLTTDRIDHWAVHPGGLRVLEEIEKSIGLTKKQLALSYEVLREVGNVSSATVIILGKQLNRVKPPALAVGVTMGAGGECGCVLLRWKGVR